LADGGSVVVRDLDDARRWPRLSTSADRLGVRSAASHGLTVRSSEGWVPLGVLTFYGAATDAFDEDDLAALSLVGSYAAVDPRVQELVCARLGLRSAEATTQVIQRDRHAEYMATLAVVASTLDKMATEIRHLARTEVREVQEPFAEGQKGSSAMPHKRNPVVCERVSGLARVIRGHAQTAFENVALWHERDISHSSAERLIFPDATGLLDFMLKDMAGVMDALVVFPERMAEHVMSLGGIAFSQSVLLALVDAGLPREDAYRIVQRAAAVAWDEDGSFREAIAADPEVRERLSDEELESLFDPRRFLRNLGGVFEQLEKVPVEGA